jgi:hypothetical protein
MKEVQNFMDDWKFHFEGLKDNNIQRESILEDESIFEDVLIPHDWGIALGYDEDQGDGATGYLLGGVGWYRKHFKIPSESLENHIVIYFDGIYDNATVYLNEKKLTLHHYGYSPFSLDLTGLVKEENVLAVKVDHSRYVDCRWYPGSGIYRNVSLKIFDDIYIDPLSFKLDSTVNSKENATVKISHTLEGESDSKLEYFIVDSNDKIACKSSIKAALNTKEISLELDVENPMLWDIDSPNLYQIVVTSQEKELYRHSFGIRKFEFTVNKGFYLNDRNVKIKGVCLHNDAGLVGSAIPKDVLRRRFKNLKICGANAIRTAHNPQSNEFLDLCDEMGFLVQEEFFDEWDYPKDKRWNMGEMHDDYLSRSYTRFFNEFCEKDLKDVVRSHYLHPSIIQWSIGNEIEWTYEGNKEATGFFTANSDGNYFFSEPKISPEQVKENLKVCQKTEKKIGETAARLVNYTKECDTSRPVVCNCILPTVSLESGVADAIDIVGFSYRSQMFDYAKKNYPDKIFMGTENLPQYHEWKAIQERAYIAGGFLWAGINYLGEVSKKGDWPVKGFSAGLLDFAAFRKASSYMFSALWNTEPEIYIATQLEEKSWYEEKDGKVSAKPGNRYDRKLWPWCDVNHHFNYNEGDRCIVEVYSSCESVELFLNDKSLGIKYLKDMEDHIYTWFINYTGGTLRAVGSKENYKDVVEELITAEEGTSLYLSIDKNVLRSNSRDCSHVFVQMNDKNGNPVRWKDESITFHIDGNANVLGCDNGSFKNVTNHKLTTLNTSEGRAMMIIQENKVANTIKIHATGVNMKSNTVEIVVE